MHNDDFEHLIKNAELAQIEGAPVAEGEITTTEPKLMRAVEYLNHLLFSVPVARIAPVRESRSEEASKELLARADAKRERKAAKRIAQLTNKA